MSPACCVCYYPGGIGSVAEATPTCPVIIHIGTDDAHIDAEQIDKVKAAHPDVPVYLYAGGKHGFNCDAREEYNPEIAKIARERTDAFLAEHLK